MREERIAKDVVSFAFPLLTGASMLLVWGTGYPGASLEALEEALAREVAGLADAGQEEVDRAIAVTETDLVRSLERVGDRADLLSMFELYFGDPDRLNRELDRYRAVTPEQIHAFAASQLGDDNRAVVTYRPEESR